MFSIILDEKSTELPVSTLTGTSSIHSCVLLNLDFVVFTSYSLLITYSRYVLHLNSNCVETMRLYTLYTWLSVQFQFGVHVLHVDLI